LWALARPLAATAADVSRGKQLPLSRPIDSYRRRSRLTAIAAAADRQLSQPPPRWSLRPPVGPPPLIDSYRRCRSTAIAAAAALVSPAAGGAAATVDRQLSPPSPIDSYRGRRH
jgi:hypothetical protein